MSARETTRNLPTQLFEYNHESILSEQNHDEAVQAMELRDAGLHYQPILQSRFIRSDDYYLFV